MLTKDIWPQPAATITCRTHSKTFGVRGFLYWLKCSSFPQSVPKNLLPPAARIFFSFFPFPTKLVLTIESSFDMNFSDSPTEVNSVSAVTPSELNTYSPFLFGEWQAICKLFDCAKKERGLTGRDVSHPNPQGNDWFNPVWMRALYSSSSKFSILGKWVADIQNKMLLEV